jgi:hypothetical protein
MRRIHAKNSLGLISALTCSLLLQGCSDSQSTNSNDSQEIQDIRRILAADCSSLPIEASKLSIKFYYYDGVLNTYDVEGMKIEVSDVDFGPSDDAASMSLHDLWGCGGIIHFR